VANRLNVNIVRTTSMPVELIARPWVSSGVLTSNQVIKSSPGVLGAVLLNVYSWAGVKITVWDSEDGDTTDDVILYQWAYENQVFIKRPFMVFPEVGIQAQNGIYVEYALIGFELGAQIINEVRYEILYR